MAPPPPCSALALDIGQRRIGLAGCDPLGLTVTPLPALRRSGFEQDLTALLALLRARRVQALVLGLPLDDAGQPTAQARHCRRYGMRLAAALVGAGLPLPLAWVNEHSSSWEAGERFGLHGDRSGRLDSAAAALLLQQWLREGPVPQLLSSGSTAPVAGGPGGDPVATAIATATAPAIVADPVATATLAADPGAGADPS